MNEAVSEAGPVKDSVLEVKSLNEAVSEAGPVKDSVLEVKSLKEAVSEAGPVKDSVLEVKSLNEAVSEAGPVKAASSDEAPIDESAPDRLSVGAVISASALASLCMPSNRRLTRASASSRAIPSASAASSNWLRSPASITGDELRRLSSERIKFAVGR